MLEEFVGKNTYRIFLFFFIMETCCRWLLCLLSYASFIAFMMIDTGLSLFVNTIILMLLLSVVFVSTIRVTSVYHAHHRGPDTIAHDIPVQTA